MEANIRNGALRCEAANAKVSLVADVLTLKTQGHQLTAAATHFLLTHADTPHADWHFINLLACGIRQAGLLNESLAYEASPNMFVKAAVAASIKALSVKNGVNTAMLSSLFRDAIYKPTCVASHSALQMYSMASYDDQMVVNKYAMQDYECMACQWMFKYAPL